MRAALRVAQAEIAQGVKRVSSTKLIVPSTERFNISAIPYCVVAVHPEVIIYIIEAMKVGPNTPESS